MKVKNKFAIAALVTAILGAIIFVVFNLFPIDYYSFRVSWWSFFLFPVLTIIFSVKGLLHYQKNHSSGGKYLSLVLMILALLPWVYLLYGLILASWR